MGDREFRNDPVSLTQRELNARLGWLIQLRWIAVGALLLGVANARWLIGSKLQFAPLLVFAATIAGINVVFALFNRHLHRTGRIEREPNVAFAMTQIAADLIVVTLAVHWTGGVNSVLVICYTFHMVLASELLVRWLAYAVALLASLMFDATVLLETMHVFPQHVLEGFTLGYWGQEELRGGEVAHICMLYNLLFFAMVYIASSISGRLREREEEVEAVNRELWQVNEAKSNFMRLASHELRTPLAAVEGLQGMIARTLARTAGYQPECEDLLERSINRLKAMRDLVNDLLEYAHLQAFTETVGKTRLDLASVVAEAIEELEPVAEQRNVRFAKDLRRCDMEGDPDQIHILAENLLANAVRYSYPHGTVEVRVRPDAGTALLEVEDHGIGIEPEALDQIFEEFFRAPSAKEYEPAGTGLGLTLCQRIADRHNGRVEVNCERGVRTLFWVRLRPQYPTQ